MKKLIPFFAILMIAFLFIPVCSAEDNSDLIAEWNLRVSVPENTYAVLEGNEYYIYAQQEGSIPYVMITTYSFDSAEDFIPAFTEYMQNQYKDLVVTSDAKEKQIGEKQCYEIDYSYTVSGYEVKDRRIVAAVDGITYMFASKEVEELDMTIGDLLENVVAECEFLPAGKEIQDELAVPGLLYCKEDGMPKYWLDFTGIMTDNLVLHCYFRSSDPTFYESVFIPDLSTADITETDIVIHNVYDEYGFDRSDWFKSFIIRFYEDSAEMIVERDESTLAGGAEDNILTGSYEMFPVGVSFRTEGDQLKTFMRPVKEGPYSVEDLCHWSQIWYFTRSGFFPPEAEATENEDGTFTVQLYEIVTNEGITHTATSAWLTLDENGSGVNDITGETVSLKKW